MSDIKAIEEALIENGITKYKTTIADAIIRSLSHYGYEIVDRRAPSDPSAHDKYHPITIEPQDKSDERHRGPFA